VHFLLDHEYIHGLGDRELLGDEELHKGGFAFAVGPDEAVAMAVRDGEGCINEKVFAASSDTEALNLDVACVGDGGGIRLGGKLDGVGVFWRLIQSFLLLKCLLLRCKLCLLCMLLLLLPSLRGVNRTHSIS